MIESMTRTNSQHVPATASQASTILVSGSTGLVGQALIERLGARGDRAVRLLRSNPGQGDVSWDPAGGEIDPTSIDADVVVHLAGENIASGRWTEKKMEAIRSSRVQGTRLLAEALAAAPRKPKVLISASAIGFYGDRQEELLTESCNAGTGFLAEVCQEWERATLPAREAGIRTVHLRIGVVLSRDGGALAKMLPPFQLGAGGRLGNGCQYMSWILLEDLVSVICKTIDDDRIEGPVNATAPTPVTNLEFTKALGRVLRRPTIAPMPAFAARLALGKMADELLLASIRVTPEVLLAHDFRFEAPEIEGALRKALGRN